MNRKWVESIASVQTHLAPGQGSGRARNDRGSAGSGSQVNRVGFGISHRGDPCWGCRRRSIGVSIRASLFTRSGVGALSSRAKLTITPWAIDER